MSFILAQLFPSKGLGTEVILVRTGSSLSPDDNQTHATGRINPESRYRGTVPGGSIVPVRGFDGSGFQEETVPEASSSQASGRDAENDVTGIIDPHQRPSRVYFVKGFNRAF